MGTNDKSIVTYVFKVSVSCRIHKLQLCLKDANRQDGNEFTTLRNKVATKTILVSLK